MDNLVIEHKDMLKHSIKYFLVVVVLAAVLIVAADQFVMSAGTAILLGALVIEIIATAATLVKAFSQDIFTEEGLTIRNVFGSKTYLWKDLERFEILWDYKGKRLMKKEEEDAPYILLKFNGGKKLRFDYLEVMDAFIRDAYGQPHVDDWTNIGK